MTLFTAHITVGQDDYVVDYDSIDEAIADESLAHLLDSDHDAAVILWVGNLRLTGTPIVTSRALREALVSNSKTILRRRL
jgi:hypothetical protein